MCHYISNYPINKGYFHDILSELKLTKSTTYITLTVGMTCKLLRKQWHWPCDTHLVTIHTYQVNFFKLSSLSVHSLYFYDNFIKASSNPLKWNKCLQFRFSLNSLSWSQYFIFDILIDFVSAISTDIISLQTIPNIPVTSSYKPVFFSSGNFYPNLEKMLVPKYGKLVNHKKVNFPF